MNRNSSPGKKTNNISLILRIFVERVFPTIHGTYEQTVLFGLNNNNNNNNQIRQILIVLEIVF